MKPASILAALCISTLIGGYAEAQSAPKFKKADLIGTWMLVSVANTTDGKTVTTFGPGEGQLDFSPNGRFVQALIRGNIPKVATDNRNTASADENKAVTQGSLVFFGTYEFDESKGELTYKIEKSTYSNFNGTEQKRAITELSSTQLKWHNPGASVGGTTNNTWTRAK